MKFKSIYQLWEENPTKQPGSIADLKICELFDTLRAWDYEDKAQQLYGAFPEIFHGTQQLPVKGKQYRIEGFTSIFTLLDSNFSGIYAPSTVGKPQIITTHSHGFIFRNTDNQIVIITSLEDLTLVDEVEPLIDPETGEVLDEDDEDPIPRVDDCPIPTTSNYSPSRNNPFYKKKK